MKIARIILLAVWAGAGCLEFSFIGPKNEKLPSSPPPAVKTPPAPVIADQVNEKNARQKAEALKQELDREEFEEMPSPGNPNPSKKTEPRP